MAVGIAARLEEVGDRRLLGLPVSRALTPATASLTGGRLLHLQGGAERLVTVVGVQERRLIRVLTRGGGSPSVSTRASEQAPSQGVSRCHRRPWAGLSPSEARRCSNSSRISATVLPDRTSAENAVRRMNRMKAPTEENSAARG